MKTYLITPSCEITEDTPFERKEVFEFLARWTGDEWNSDVEPFATRTVYEDEADEDSPPDYKPWTVSYDDRYQDPTESFEVARFSTEAEADAFAAKENTRIFREFVNDESNFARLELPDDIEPYIGNVCTGQYPQSRKVLCTLTRQGISTEANARWSASGVTETWPRLDTIKETLIGLISELSDASVNAAQEQPA